VHFFNVFLFIKTAHVRTYMCINKTNVAEIHFKMTVLYFKGTNNEINKNKNKCKRNYGKHQLKGNITYELSDLS